MLGSDTCNYVGGYMKLKYHIQKIRDQQAQDLYWGSPERYNMEAYQKGFNAAVEELIKTRLVDPQLVTEPEENTEEVVK